MNWNTMCAIIGAVIGGLVVGSLAKLLRINSINLLLGMVLEDITGGLEGVALGVALGVGLTIGGGFDSPRSI